MKEENLYHTDLPVGEILRRTREHYGQSILDVEKALRIRVVQIKAIEEGNVDALPGRVYAIGFVRSYSEYLGLDGAKMVQLFKEQVGRQAHDPELHFPVAASDTKLPSFLLVAGSLILAVVVGAFWINFQSTDRGIVEEIPSVSDAMNEIVIQETLANSDVGTIENENTGSVVLEKSLNENAEEISSVVQTQPSIKDNTIILNVTQNSWVEIKDDKGEMLVSKVLKAGERYFIPSSSDLSMSLGNAAGVVLETNGASLGPLGESGDVRRDIPMQIDTLIKRYGIRDQKVLKD